MGAYPVMLQILSLPPIPNTLLTNKEQRGPAVLQGILRTVTLKDSNLQISCRIVWQCVDMHMWVSMGRCGCVSLNQSYLNFLAAYTRLWP